MNPISGILSLVSTVVSRIWPDKTESEKAQLALALQQELDSTQILVAQATTNTAEAQHDNLFLAGWRPAVGWSCALTFVWCFLLQPVVVFVATISGHTVPPLPHLDISDLMPVLLGMLGLGAMRTVEKVQNAQGNH